MQYNKNLRILEVVQSLEKGGRTTRFSDTVSGLREHKHFVLPLCLSKPKQWVNIPDLQIIEKHTGINWTLVFQIRKVIKESKINLIHAHCEFSQLYASIAGFSLGIKTVATFHRSDLAKYRPNLVNSLIQLFASHFVAVSHDRLSLLTENLKLPASKCHVVHGGTVIENKPTSDSINKIRAELNIPKNQVMLLSIGHLGVIKGHQDTLTALAQLSQENQDIHLYIAGDGSDDEKQQLSTLVEKLQIQKHVTFLGQVNHSCKWFEACDIFIQPSIEEAFGLVFVEAGAKAKPVIATAVGGIKEIILPEITGLLVPPAAPEELKHALTVLINSSALRTQYGENGYQRVTESFSLTAMINKYTDIFKIIVK
jgi:glycosyltransferase involved in cell wall biosynthesis